MNTKTNDGNPSNAGTDPVKTNQEEVKLVPFSQLKKAENAVIREKNLNKELYEQINDLRNQLARNNPTNTEINNNEEILRELKTSYAADPDALKLVQMIEVLTTQVKEAKNENQQLKENLSANQNNEKFVQDITEYISTSLKQLEQQYTDLKIYNIQPKRLVNYLISTGKINNMGDDYGLSDLIEEIYGIRLEQLEYKPVTSTKANDGIQDIDWEKFDFSQPLDAKTKERIFNDPVAKKYWRESYSQRRTS